MLASLSSIFSISGHWQHSSKTCVNFGRSHVQGTCVTVRFYRMKTQIIHRDEWAQPQFVNLASEHLVSFTFRENTTKQRSIEAFEKNILGQSLSKCSDTLVSCLQTIVLPPIITLPFLVLILIQVSTSIEFFWKLNTFYVVRKQVLY